MSKQWIKRPVRLAKEILLGRNKRGYVDHKPKSMGTELIERKKDDINAVFMHIHKCAGTSIAKAVENSPNVITCGSLAGDYPGRTGRDSIPDEIWDGAVKFTVVRNPYARIVSAYSMFRKSPRWAELFPDFDAFIGFLRLVDLDAHTPPRSVDLLQYRGTLDNLIHHCTTFQNSKYHLGEMTFIAKLESLEDNLRQMDEQFGVKISHVSQMKKTGGGNSYRDFYNQQTREAVKQMYQCDLDQFDYEY
jgi:hypothetical protein